MIKLKQLITENKGIDDLTLPGYNHLDALTKEGSPTHQIIKSDMCKFANDLREMYPSARKFLDVGSGAAYLSEKIREFGDDYLAVSLDGNKESIELPSINNDYHFIVRTDENYELADENNNRILFDIVTSFEHFEHIHPDKFDVFIDNIKKHMHGNSVLYASAANWSNGENDNIHINMKTNSEWETIMDNYGFEKVEKKLFKQDYNYACGARWEFSHHLAYKLKNY